MLITAITFAAAAMAQLPPKLHPVKPVRSNTAAQSSANLRVGQGRFFSYALPQGWRVGEDGQFALTLVAPDNKAITVMVGNAGYPPNYPAGQFIHEKLSAMRPANLRMGPGQQATPIAGFNSAVQFEVTYVASGGIPSRGLVKCHIATSYDTAVMVMTAALSEAGQWPGYSSWLPMVAEQISATNGGAFGRRGIMAQNLKNSMAFGEAARRYREWSQRNWQQVTDDRNASQDRRNLQVRENLGGVQTYVNPNNPGVPVELPTTYKYFWVDDQGNYGGTDDPSVNPNVGSKRQWKRLTRRQP